MIVTPSLIECSALVYNEWFLNVSVVMLTRLSALPYVGVDSKSLITIDCATIYDLTFNNILYETTINAITVNDIAFIRVWNVIYKTDILAVAEFSICKDGQVD